MFKKERERESQVPVSHAYNPNCSGGSDQEDSGLKPARTNTSKTLSQKKSFTKKDWWGGSRCRP
jgi:hypothetical protein